VTTAQAIRGIAYYALLALLLYLVVRAPKNVPLRAIVILIASWAVGYPFGLAAADGRDFLGLDPMVCQLIQTILSLAGEYSLVCFFLFTVYERSPARRRARVQALAPAVIAVVVTISALSVPPALRADAATVTKDALKEGYESTVPVVGAFYFFSNLYTLYAFGYALMVTYRCARHGAERRQRQGMWLVAVGLVAMLLALSTYVIANVYLWAGHSSSFPSLILVIGTVSMFVGIPLFIAGLGYRAVTMRLAALRVWWQHRRAYLNMSPLWTLLHVEFPEDAFGRVPTSSWRDALSLRAVHRRYYRRAIECRDGLVRLSPHMAGIGGDDPPRQVADRLRQALRNHAAGVIVSTAATRIVVPVEHGLDADVHELVALSRALRAS
jgi:uncharacterized membrane protein